MRNVNDLTVHDIVNIATKVTFIRNVRHIRNVMMARNTETARRLWKFGTIYDACMCEVIYIVSRELGIDGYSVVENLICETSRWMEGGKSENYAGMDKITINQPLYQIVDDVLHKIRCCGDREVVNGDELQNIYPVMVYDPKFHCWRLIIDNPCWLLGKGEDLVLAHSSKLVDHI